MKATTTARSRATKKTLAQKPANDATPSQRSAAPIVEPSTKPAIEPGLPISPNVVALITGALRVMDGVRAGETGEERARWLIWRTLSAIISLIRVYGTPRGDAILAAMRSVARAADVDGYDDARVRLADYEEEHRAHRAEIEAFEVPTSMPERELHKASLMTLLSYVTENGTNNVLHNVILEAKIRVEMMASAAYQVAEASGGMGRYEARLDELNSLERYLDVADVLASRMLGRSGPKRATPVTS